MKKKFALTLGLSLIVAALSITSSASATQNNFSIYNSSSQNGGYVSAFSTIAKDSSQTVGIAGSSTVNFNDLIVSIYSVGITISGYKNGSFYDDNSATTYSPYTGDQATTSVALGTFDGTQSHYTGVSTHYVYRSDGIRTGYGTLTPTWIN